MAAFVVMSVSMRGPTELFRKGMPFFSEIIIFLLFGVKMPFSKMTVIDESYHFKHLFAWQKEKFTMVSQFPNSLKIFSCL